MKIVHINTVFRGSTGKIMLDLARSAIASGDEAYTFSDFRQGDYPTFHSCIGSRLESLFNRGISSITGISEIGSVYATRQLLKKMDRIKPDVIHLHNLHGWYLCVPMLFRYLKRHNIRVVWTLHDCWSFTGQCSHFTMEKCEKWKTGCYHCPRYRLYPSTFVDRTDVMWRLKKKWFTGVKDMTIVTPSHWLADLVKQSFLKDYPVKVIHNGIDLSVFKPTPSDFRKKYDILENKRILLGVASGWSIRKGLDVFLELEQRLDKKKYQIVLVGTDEKVDKQLPSGIISIHRTQNQQELAEIYTAADLFMNLSREENYPTVNMEAIACGTPVLTFRTGGSAEILDKNTGAVVNCDNMDAVEQTINRICESRVASEELCMGRRLQFEKELSYKIYFSVYNFGTQQKEE